MSRSRLPMPARRLFAPLAVALFTACTTSPPDLTDQTPLALTMHAPPAAVVDALESGNGDVAFWQAADGLVLQASIRVRDRHVDLTWRRSDGRALSRSLQVPFWPTAVFFDVNQRMCVAGKSVEGLAFVEAFTVERPTAAGERDAAGGTDTALQAEPGSAHGSAEPSGPEATHNAQAGPPPPPGTRRPPPIHPMDPANPGSVADEVGQSAHATPLVGGDIRSSRTLFVLETPDLIRFAFPDPDRAGSLYVQLLASRELYRITPDIAGGHQLERLASPRDQAPSLGGATGGLVAPGLAFAYTHLHVAQHKTAGRMLLFTEGTFTRGLALIDGDQDGRFEASVEAGTPEWQALALFDPKSFD